MKSTFKFLVLCAMLTLTACSSYKKIPYLQNDEYTNALNEKTQLYDAKIMPKDILTITVNTTDPNASAPFNLTIQRSMDGGTTGTSNYSAGGSGYLQSYLVNNDGTIEFPVLGQLSVVGLTKTECQEMIKEKLKPYIKETPIVTVRMSSFSITVLGEVNGGGQYTISREKINILEAIALAGDLTIYGRRDNVKLLREDANGKRHIYTININDASIIYNPLYQLQQNDIIYVTPMKVKAKNSYYSANTSILFTSISLVTSLTSVGLLLWNVLKKN